MNNKKVASDIHEWEYENPMKIENKFEIISDLNYGNFQLLFLFKNLHDIFYIKKIKIFGFT